MAQASGMIPLYLYGYASGVSSLNLYLAGTTPELESNTVDLYLNAGTSGTTGFYGYMPLYMASDPYRASINLYTYGYANPVLYNNYLNLYLHSTTPSLDNSLDLFMTGSEVGGTLGSQNNNVKLYIKGDGLIPGATPFSSWMNLFLHHPGAHNSLNLFLNATGPLTNHIDLFTHGISGSLTKGLDLYIARYGAINHNLDLFIRGWNSTTPTLPSGFDSLSDLTLSELYALFLDELHEIGL